MALERFQVWLKEEHDMEFPEALRALEVANVDELREKFGGLSKAKEAMIMWAASHQPVEAE